MRAAYATLGLVFVLGASFAALQAACTPAQQGHVRTALDINQCANAIVVRHIDAGDDFKDVAVLAVIAGEIASECIPTQKDGA